MKRWLDRIFPVGSRSVLFGAHCFFLHPWFVAAAWCKLNGFPWDPRLWVAFIVHDIGYFGKPNIDGPEGEAHPQFGAGLMHSLFDRPCCVWKSGGETWADQRWYEFTLFHSRHYAKRLGRQPSRLCYADKLGFVLEPRWLYLLRVRLSGELVEFLANAAKRGEPVGDAYAWHTYVCRWTRAWVAAHKDGAPDTWTPADRNTPERI
jgi:hypothetical protein